MNASIIRVGGAVLWLLASPALAAEWQTYVNERFGATADGKIPPASQPCNWRADSPVMAATSRAL